MLKKSNSKIHIISLLLDNGLTIPILNENVDEKDIKKLALSIRFQPLEETIINTKEEFEKNLDFPAFDFSDVKGQESIKRCMEIAAAGGHNIILIGPPGAGKTMLAKRLPSILPPMTIQEALETTKIHSVVGRVKENAGLMSQRPFRSPHHTISNVIVLHMGVTV